MKSKFHGISNYLVRNVLFLDIFLKSFFPTICQDNTLNIVEEVLLLSFQVLFKAFQMRS